MAGLVAIHTGAQDAGHGAEGEHSRVPHLPVGVCLPVVGAGWNMESREEAGRVSASGWPRVSSPKSRGCQEHTSCIACKMLAREQNLYQPCIPQGLLRMESPPLASEVLLVEKGECWSGNRRAGELRTTLTPGDGHSSRSTSPPCRDSVAP